MTKYNKLIRDKIPELLRQKNQRFRVHIADNTEYWNKLKEKLQEEVHEFNTDENIEEFIDILEVLDAISEYKNFSKDVIQTTQQTKHNEKGGFAQRIILEES